MGSRGAVSAGYRRTDRITRFHGADLAGKAPGLEYLVAAAAQQMHETNRRLRDFLELIPQQESGPLRIGPADLTSLLAELKNVERFRKNEINADARLDTELAEYR